MNAWRKRSCSILELSLAVSGAPCLSPDATMHLCYPRSGLQSLFHEKPTHDTQDLSFLSKQLWGLCLPLPSFNKDVLKPALLETR